MTGFVRQTLPELFQDIPVVVVSASGMAPVPITGIVCDSRSVQPGNLFVALAGGSVNGHSYIPSAIEQGAAAVVGSQPQEGLPVPYIQVSDTRFALAHLAAAFYNFPARQLTMIGVTGTDGKTTTSNLIFQILLAAGYPAGVISTVNAVIGSEVVDTGFHVTTPEAPDVQHYLARMLAAGLTHVVLESTSHGLAQQRVTACEFDIAVITNITHEHLDYHGSFQAYREAKASLFTGLANTRKKKGGRPLAVLNRDDQSYDYLHQVTPGEQVDYSLHPGAAVWAQDIHYSADGINFTAIGPGFHLPIRTSLVGAFNVSNCLAALAATMAGLGVPAEAVQRGITALPGVPGRMERIDLGQDFTAIVDFAHTPNALRRALETVRLMTRGRILAVFGSAGLRDREKRRMMAEVSVELADLTFLTAEDPRTESLDDILAEMALAAVGQGGVEGKNLWRVPDRGQAIRMAVKLAQPGDLVIACGKGHEQSMCFGTLEHPWDDRTAMRAALAERLGLPGPAMPYLPTQNL
jgi:UDP-N-acetylmuramoyl-L-alanyl-D-glutamate--2,6-diaminopimelate ligase